MLLLSTSSLSGYGLHRIFHFAKSAGYEGIDLSIDFDSYDSSDSAYIDSLVQEVGIPVVSITAPERKLTKKQFEEIISLASSLGVTIINVHPPHRLDKEKDWFGDYLKKTDEKHGDIMINIVNAPPKTWLFIISEYGDARPETIKKITNHTALSIENVDPSSGVDLMKTFVLLGSTMQFVYLSDKNEEKSGLFPWEWNMPLESLLIKMKELGYTWHFSLAVAPESLSAGKDENIVHEHLEKAKKFLAKYFN